MEARKTQTRPPALSGLDLEKAGALAPQQQLSSPTGWADYAKRHWKKWVGGIALVMGLCGTAALLNGEGSEVRGHQGQVVPNKDALLSLTAQDFEALTAQVDLQINESYQRLITLEAVRFLGEAEKQSTDPSADCYRMGTECALDQFELDAFTQYRNGTDSLDRGAQLQALIRLQIVDEARTGVRVAPEPDNALTAAAIHKRLEARQLQRQASAESIAADLLED